MLDYWVSRVAGPPGYRRRFRPLRPPERAPFKRPNASLDSVKATYRNHSFYGSDGPPTSTRSKAGTRRSTRHVPPNTQPAARPRNLPGGSTRRVARILEFNGLLLLLAAVHGSCWERRCRLPTNTQFDRPNEYTPRRRRGAAFLGGNSSVLDTLLYGAPSRTGPLSARSPSATAARCGSRRRALGGRREPRRSCSVRASTASARTSRRARRSTRTSNGRRARRHLRRGNVLATLAQARSSIEFAGRSWPHSLPSNIARRRRRASPRQ